MDTGKDLRLYYMDSGILKKVENRFHKRDNIKEFEELILKNSKKDYFNVFWQVNQFVVIEYSSSYEGKIVAIIEREKTTGI